MPREAEGEQSATRPSESSSLRGRTVMVTRALDQAPELVAPLEALGATAIVAPAIDLVRAPRGALDRAVTELAAGGFDWIVFTSRAGVDAVMERLDARDLDGAAMDAEVAAVGEGTAARLRERGIDPSLVPETYTTHALSRAMPRGSGRVLLPRADIATGELETAIAAKGWTPVRVDAYRTKLARRMPPAAARALRSGRVDAVTFTSASTVEGFAGMVASMGPLPSPRPRIVCIGPVTARTAHDHGLEVDGVARPHTIEGLIAALERVLRRRTKKERG